MTTWEMIAQRARELPVDKQREVLDFVELLRVHQAPKRPLRDVAGLFKGFDISPEDIDEARRKMWGAFPPSTKRVGATLGATPQMRLR